MKWTDRQQQVIDARGQNILVSAAAGSGKTAVLVERIVKKVMDKDKPIDVDRLLVVTFTKAAAAEMRQRVLLALEKAAEEDPNNEHIQKQQTYIHNAQITTIDAFCARIVREHFDMIDIDPNTKIVDEAEIEMLQDDVITQLLEEKYDNQDSEFLKLSDKYTDPKNISDINNIITTLYKASMSFVNPLKWLEDCKKVYNIKGEDDLLKSEWFQYNLQLMMDKLLECIKQLKIAVDFGRQSEGTEKYVNYLITVKEEIEEALSLVHLRDNQNSKYVINTPDSYNEFRKRIMGIGFPNAPRFTNVEPTVKSRMVGIRDKVKDDLLEIKESYLSQSIEETTLDIIECSKTVNTLVDVTVEFYHRFRNEKIDRGIMDFADQEHFALEILLDMKEDGSYLPSEIAKELSTQFEEIMIDEYQDSNYVQEAILTSVSRGHGVNNVFMVGDVKQSIYKFRLANPNLFIEKYNTYSEKFDAPERKIILDKNFRSRKEIINSVNYIFKNLMHRDLGGIEYDEDNELVLGADYDVLPEGQDNSTEFIIVDKNGNENEVRAIARKIKEYVDPNGGFKIQKENGYETPRYRDIVILLKSIKDRGEEYVKYLEQEGIPAYCESKTGYYDTKEVSTIMDFLKIIDNPYQDIPLAAVLRSGMYNYLSEELAKIKLMQKDGALFDAMKLYLENGTDRKLAEKINCFINSLEKYRKLVSYTSVYDLITTICNDTGYTYYISSMPGGKRRTKNIEILKEKALTYDEGAYKGLFNFVRYIGKIKELGKDEGEASVVNENDNIVRIMTIHKSKGLQFPIVFISSLDTQFNMKSTTGPILTHDKWLLGIDFIDNKLKVKKTTALKSMIKNVIREEEYGEFIRLLYVAMTRAKEKMILTASVTDGEKFVEELLVSRNADEITVPYSVLMDKNKFSYWLGYALVKNKAFDGISEKMERAEWVKTSWYDYDADMKSDYIRNDEIFCQQVEDGLNEKLNKNQLINWDEDIIYDEQLKKNIESKLNWVYEFEGTSNIPAKASVTELKSMFAYEEDEEADNYLLSGKNKYEEKIGLTFNNENKKLSILTGANLGTAYHKIFELFDFEMEPTKENIINMLDRYESVGAINSLTKASVNVEKLLAFTKSSLYERMKAAYNRKELYRERAFLMGVRACDIIPNTDSEEMIVVQGIIDVCFLEDGKYVIADYKTDQVNDINELEKKYSIQLQCYAKALNMIDKKGVSELIIYSVKFDDEKDVQLLEELKKGEEDETGVFKKR